MFVILVEVVIKGEEPKHCIIGLLCLEYNLHLCALFGYELGCLHNNLVLLDARRLQQSTI